MLQGGRRRRLGWSPTASSNSAAPGLGVGVARNIGTDHGPGAYGHRRPRIHTQQVAGLPLIHVTTPTLEGGQRVAKRLFDVVVSALLIIALVTPHGYRLALLVKIDSRGPVLFRQERVGIEGAHFEMLKFRSMVVDAEERLAELCCTTTKATASCSRLRMIRESPASGESCGNSASTNCPSSSTSSPDP